MKSLTIELPFTEATLFYRTPLVAASIYMIPDYIINTNKRKYLKINMYLSQWTDCSEAAIQEVLWKKGVFKNFAKFKGKQLCWSLFFKKVEGLKRATLYWKRDSIIGVFLWILWNFYKDLFYGAPTGGCLWLLNEKQ